MSSLFGPSSFSFADLEIFEFPVHLKVKKSCSLRCMHSSSVPYFFVPTVNAPLITAIEIQKFFSSSSDYDIDKEFLFSLIS